MKAQIALDRAIAAENRKLQAVINAEKKLWKDIFKEGKSVFIARKKFQVNRRNFHRVICRSMGNRKNLRCLGLGRHDPSGRLHTYVECYKEDFRVRGTYLYMYSYSTCYIRIYTWYCIHDTVTRHCRGGGIVLPAR